MNENPAPPLSAHRSRARRIGLSASTFMAVNIFRQLLMFALLPLLTTRVPPEQYGRVTVAAAIAAVALILMSLGLETPVFRAWFETVDDPQRRAEFLSTARTLLLGASVAVAAIFAVGVWAADVGSEAWSPPLIVMAVAGSVGQSVIGNYALPLFRAQDRLGDYIRVEVTVSAVQMALLVVLVIALPLGAGGWVLAIALAQWAGAVTGMTRLRSDLGLGIDAPACRSLLNLSLPLVPHALAHWSLAGVDRLVLLAYVPAATVGIYGMVYAVSALVGTALMELNRALMSEYGRLLKPDERPEVRANDLAALASIQIIAALVIGFGAAALGPPAFRLFFAESYKTGAAVIPWVVLGHVFFGIYFVPVVRLSIIEGRSRWLAAATLLGAFVNFVGNLVLIPLSGMLGAAQATVAGYAVMLICVTAYARRVSTTKLELPSGGVLILMALAATAWAAVRAAEGLGTAWGLAGAVAATASIALLGGAMARTQLQRMKSTLETPPNLR